MINNVGQLKTSVEVLGKIQTVRPGGFVSEEWQSIFAKPIRVKWQNVHGSEALTANAMQYRDYATITMRYSDKVTPQCKIRKLYDDVEFDIVSMDNIYDSGHWLEIKVKRAVNT